MEKNNRYGFTFLELLIVMAIASVLTVGSLASYRSFNQRKILDAESRKFVTALEVAKKRASTGQKICPEYTGHYQVVWSNSTYITTPVGCTGSDVITYHLPGGLDFNDQSGTLVFKPFGLGTTLTGEACAIMRNTLTEACKEVRVSTGGTIELNDSDDCAC